jgi:ribose-phosphate pyrophosphokinase
MTVFIGLPENEKLAADLAKATGGRLAQLSCRQFPDGESYVRILDRVGGERVVLVCTLADPDCSFLRLVFAAGAAREAGAARVDLVAPYLAYMRQDRAFADGEAVSARHFARLLSAAVDSLVTIDPHLHRIHSLSEVFDIPARALHAAPLLADWIAANVDRPLVIGPDAESRQWVEDVAGQARAPYAVLRKVRRGDRDVEITLPDLSAFAGRNPVLVDDIVSSGRTMLKAAAALQNAGFAPPVVLAVHALMAEDAYALLRAVSSQVVTTDSVPHPSNAVSILPLLRQALTLH